MAERHLRLVKDSDLSPSQPERRGVHEGNKGRLGRALQSVGQVAQRATELMDKAADSMAGPTNGDKRAIENIDRVIRGVRPEMVATSDVSLAVNIFQRGIAEKHSKDSRQALLAIVLNGGEVRGIVGHTRSDERAHYFDGLEIVQLPYGNNKYHASGGHQQPETLKFIPSDSISLRTEIADNFEVEIDAQGDCAIGDLSGRGTVVFDPHTMQDLQDPKSELPFAQDFVNDVLMEWGDTK